MKIKVICPNCHKEIDIEKDVDVFECPECHKAFTYKSVVDFTNIHIKKYLRSAEQYESNAYSYKDAFYCYNEVLRFLPNNLDAFLGKLLNGIKKSTLKDTYFKQFIEDFNNQDLVLDPTTYIRIGHFFEEVLLCLFKYVKAMDNLISIASNDEEKIIAYKNLLDVNELYKLINENIALFNEQEYQDSVFISKDQINAEEEFIKKYLNDSNIYKLSEKLDDTLIFSGNIKLKYSEFNIDDYSNIQDYYVFKLNVNADKYKYIFIALALFIAVSIVGLVLTLTMEDKTPGYITLGVSLGLFALTYIGFILLRRKTLKDLSK